MGGELKGSLEVEEVEVEGVEGGGGWRCLDTMERRDPTTVTLLGPSCTKQMGALSPQCRSDALERGSSRFDTETALRYY